jgi:hypothetical protein
VFCRSGSGAGYFYRTIDITVAASDGMENDIEDPK